MMTFSLVPGRRADMVGASMATQSPRGEESGESAGASACARGLPSARFCAASVIVATFRSVAIGHRHTIELYASHQIIGARADPSHLGIDAGRGQSEFEWRAKRDVRVLQVRCVALCLLGPQVTDADRTSDTMVSARPLSNTRCARRGFTLNRDANYRSLLELAQQRGVAGCCCLPPGVVSRSARPFSMPRAEPYR